MFLKSLIHLMRITVVNFSSPPSVFLGGKLSILVVPLGFSIVFKELDTFDEDYGR